MNWVTTPSELFKGMQHPVSVQQRKSTFLYFDGYMNIVYHT